jgi:DMSO reductase anchor subunit
MHPALSVIIFTVASGIGTGMLVWLPINVGLGNFPAAGISQWLPDRWFGIAAFGVAFGMIVAGLIASTFHLGHPERAWRAFSQWRSSWLSREGVMSIALFVPTGIFAIGFVIFERAGGWWLVAGGAGFLFCLATTYCTAMIYASLKPVRAWNLPLVPRIYLVLSLASGAAWLVAIARIFNQPFSYADIGLVGVTMLALDWKRAYWKRIDGIHAGQERHELTTAQAIGFRSISRAVQPLDPPHTEENYLMKEMGFVVARRHALKLRRLTILFAFILPVALWFLSVWLIAPVAAVLLLIGAISMTAGLLIERWLFFAEAKHSVMLYYRGDEIG